MLKMFNKVTIYGEEEIALIKESSLLVGKTLTEVAKKIAPGVKTRTLDKLAEDFIRSNGATPTFKGYRGFPYALCISVNDVVVHGFPGDYELKEGDIISVDCGVCKNGFNGDYAYTFPVGDVSEEIRKLLKITKESLFKGIAAAVSGQRVGDIGYAIQSYCEAHGYGVVRELCGHGVGRNLHEKPDVPNYGRRGNGVQLKEGMVLAIEPMINMGTRSVFQENDGWTIRTRDGKPSAHFEHNIVVRKGKAEVLSGFEEIESVFGLKY